MEAMQLRIFDRSANAVADAKRIDEPERSRVKSAIDRRMRAWDAL